MSPITKMFVVLHVVLSMLLTAGVVVFVNRVDDYAKTVADLKQQNTAANQKAAQAGSAESAAKEALNKANADLQAQVQAATTERNNAAIALGAVNTQLADATKQLAIVQADNSKYASLAQASQAAQSAYAAQVTELRTTVDTLTKSKFELDTAVADLTNQRDVLEKQRRDLAEKVSMLDGQYKDAVAIMKDHNIDPTKLTSAPGIGRGAPPINGVVNEVRMIEQVPYATISVGSADAVVKGMEFKVLDRTKGDFLGVLTVESVDTNEATGRLDGPHVDQVRKGVDVRTQL